MENKETKSNNKVLKSIKVIGNIGYWVLAILLIAIAVLTVSSVLGFPEKLRVFVVQSGSMEPAIKTGSISIVKPYEDYSDQDIITYVPESNPEVTVTHRIIETEESEDGILYTTQGDANESSDANPVNKEAVVGKVIFSVPYLGYPVSFAKTELGFILLIVIPATIIVYSEMMTIKKEAKRLIKERKKRKLTAQEKIIKVIGEEEIAVENWFKRMFKKLNFRKNNQDEIN